MGPIPRQSSSFLQQVLPAVLLFAALAGLPLAASAQQEPPNATVDSSAQSAATDSDSQITPEDIGDSMLVHRRYQEAIDAYKNASDDSYDIWNKRGIAYQMLYDLKDAERCYKQSLRLKPDHAWALNNLGSIYDAQGDFKKSEALYRRALALDPDSARIAANLGSSLMAQDKYQEGAELYKRALKLDPDIFDTNEGPIAVNGVPLEQRAAMNYYKARDFAQAGFIDRAISYLRKALNQGFTSPAKIIQDSSFDRLRGNPAFDSLLTEHK
ncbi:MAG TPA: tetratricopeptide repeat protein [Terracidiphilus sp.]|nr:tetratricopeptide repeat protein [Terracidiphilus sp.]